MKPIVALFAVAGLALTAAGCSVAMAAHQPSKKDLKVFSQGMPRALVVTEVGAPVTTETRSGKRVEVYAFMQGYSKGARVGWATDHGVADVMTFGIESVGVLKK